MQNCQAVNNGREGIWVSDNCIVSDCVATFNSANGIHVSRESIVRDCVTHRNRGSGIRAGNDNRIVKNLCDNNDLDGILLTSGDNRVEENHVTDGLRGIFTSLSGVNLAWLRLRCSLYFALKIPGWSPAAMGVDFGLCRACESPIGSLGDFRYFTEGQQD